MTTPPPVKVPRAHLHLGWWVAALLLWALVVVPDGSLAARRLFSEGVNDFTILRLSAARAAAGQPLYAPLTSDELERWPYESLGNLNLPHTHLLLRPLAAVPYRTAALLWALASLAAAAGSLVAIARELKLPFDARTGIVGGAFILGSAPFVSTALAGEVSFLLMAPFTAGWIALRRRSDASAGAWLGLCAAVKPFLGLYFVWFLVTGRIRAVASFVSVVLIAVAAGAVAYGARAYVAWIAAVQDVVWWWPPENASLRGLGDRLFAAGHGMTPLVDRPDAALWFAGAAAAFVVLLTAWRTRDGTRDASETDRDTALWFLASLLASPLGWVYYVPMVSGAIVAALSTARFSSRADGWLLGGGVLLLVPLRLTEAGQPSALATLTLASAYSWALLALWHGLLAGRPGRMGDGDRP